MIKKTLLILMINILVIFSASSQEVETITLSKQKTTLYQGLGEELKDWYFYFDADSLCYLAQLTIPIEEVQNWFDKRKNSNNIFKGKMDLGQYPTLMLSKDNEPETRMNFYVTFESQLRINLNSVEDGVIYEFIKK